MKTQNRINTFIAAALLLVSFSGFSQETEKEKDTRTFQVSFVPPLGTNGHEGPTIANKISYNIIAGYSRGVEAVEVGGVYNIVKEDVNGAQVSGLGNTVGGDINGIQSAGLVNTVRGNVEGAQIAGFLNYLAGHTNGVQTAGFANLASDVNGVQAGGFYNQNTTTNGAQLAGFMNLSGDVNGAQAAGFINIAKKVSGVQIGFINIADSVASGVPVGVVNIVKKNGFISPGFESDGAIPYRFVFRSGLEKFYTILSAGIKPGDYWTYGAGLGSRIYLSQQHNLFLNPELRWHSVNEGKAKVNESNQLVKFNLNVGFQAFKHLYITTGPSVNFYVTNELDEFGQPLIDLSSNPSVDELSGNRRYQMWIGYTIGIGF